MEPLKGCLMKNVRIKVDLFGASGNPNEGQFVSAGMFDAVWFDHECMRSTSYNKAGGNIVMVRNDDGWFFHVEYAQPENVPVGPWEFVMLIPVNCNKEA